MITLAAAEWEARLLPEQGGAVAALSWRGRDVLVPLPLGAEPNGSFAGAFLMAPWANRLDRGLLPVAGLEHHLPINRPEDDTAIHGLSRDLPWEVAERAAGRVVLAQVVVGPPPFHYAARLELALGAEGAALRCSLTNLAEAPCPHGLGWHPFFARPPGTRLRFAATTLFARDARCLPVAAQPSSGVDGEEFEGLDTAFAGWDGVAEIAWPDATLHLAASGAWAGNLQVFAPSGGNVLCVEPVSHVPDAPNRPEFAALGALTMLPPGAALEAQLLLRVDA